MNKKVFESVIRASQEARKSKQVTEKFHPSIPDWMKPTYKYDKSGLKGAQGPIDISNAEFVPLDTLGVKDPMWKNDDYILAFNTPNGVYMADRNKVYRDNDYYDNNGRWKHLSNTSRAKLIDMATEMGYIKKSSTPRSDSNASKYGRYKDPRKGVSHGYYGGYNKDEYAGQYQGSDGNWYTNSGRDKSGYAIPKPEDLLAKYYNVQGIEDVQRVLDAYYNKLTKIRDDINSLDFRKSNNSSLLSELYRDFGRAIDNYLDFANECKTKIRRIAEQGIPDYYDSFADYFNDNSYYKKQLSDYVIGLQQDIRKVKDNMNESKIIEEAYKGLDISPFHPFTKNDWYGYAGACEFPNGDEPLIFSNNNVDIIICDDENGKCSISVYPFVEEDFGYGYYLDGLSLVKCLKMGSRIAEMISNSSINDTCEFLEDNGFKEY